jgi:argininosuccinate lyase
MPEPEDVFTEDGFSDTAPAASLIEAGFALEVADAPLLHGGLNLADIAHVMVLHEQRLIPRDSAQRLLRLLLEVHGIPAAEFPYDPAYGDPYNCRERFFAGRIGLDAGWLHAGRPRREAGRLALRVELRSQILSLIPEVAGFVDAVARIAEAEAETLMPDQTYLQQAQPSTFGHYVLTFAYPALREARRLWSEQEWVNQSPGGAGCVNGSRLHISRARTAELLGFDGVIEHTRDAMWQTDGLVTLLSTAAGLVSNLSKLAEDLEIWDSREFDFVDLAGPYTRASVLMPQKRNPYSLAIVRGAAGVLLGRLAGFLAVVKTPSARSDNLIFAYGEVPRALELTQKVTRLMSGVISTLHVNAGRMNEALLSGFSQATDLAEHVMQTCGVDYRTAYLLVGEAVRRASREGLRGVDVTGEMLDGAAEKTAGHRLGLAGTDLANVLDPGAIVSTRTLPGGAAPGIVRQMAADCTAAASGVRTQADEAARKIGEAEAALLTLARATAGD